MERVESIMKHVQLDTKDESVKRFVLELTVDAGGCLLELNGKPVACVILPSTPSKNSSTTVDWTERKNQRRCDLIDREIDGVITIEETIELRQLQDEMLRYQQRVAPWPIEAARQLHRKLLKKAAKSQHGPAA
jgi:hypothetical protein